MAEEGKMSWTIRLNETERDLLINLLESEFKQIRSSVYHAESHSVKELLKEREASINQILKELKDA